MAKAPTKTNREKMQELKDSMRDEQRNAAVELRKITEDYEAKLAKLRDKTIPGEIVEQSIDNITGMTAQLGTWTDHIVAEPEIVELPDGADTPAP